MTMLCIRVTPNTLHLISFDFRFTFLECSSTFLRSVFKRFGSLSELIFLRIILKKVTAVSLLKCYDGAVDQTIVKIKKKNWIVVMVMMWWRHEFINDRNLWRRFKGFGMILAFRSLKNFTHWIPMLGIKPGPWRWELAVREVDPTH